MHTPSLVLAVCLPLLPSDPPQPGDYNWGSGITALEHAVVDFWISATITTHQPQSHTSANGPFGYTVTQGPAEGGPDEVLFKVDCGDEDPPKEYSVPMFGFLAPPGPNGATNNYARAAYNEDGEPAIGFSIDALWPQSDTFLWGLYGADPFSSEYYVAFDAWVLSALFNGLAHIDIDVLRPVQVGHRLTQKGERVRVVLRVMIGDTRFAAVNIGSAELLR